MTKYGYRYKKRYPRKKKRRLIKSRFFWILLLAIVAVGAVAYLILFAPFFQIKEINISGNQKTDSEKLENLVAEKIKSKVIALNSKSIFLVDLKNISSEILARFPQIGEANLKRSFPETLFVGIRERKSVGIWCRDNNCFHIDSGGIIFEAAEKDKSDVVIISEDYSGKMSLPVKVISDVYLKGAIEISRTLEGNVDIKEFIISEERNKLHAITEEGWKIYFNPKENIKEELVNLNLVLKERIPPEERKNLEYFDLRYGNKVYYKYYE